jgi:hypothetical protein
MNVELLRRHATGGAAALFAVVGLSGVLIFFHLGESAFKGMHEWLGLAFVAASILHVWRNFPAFTKVLGRRATQVLFAVSLLAAGAFVAASGGDGGNPMRMMVDKVAAAPLSAVAPVLGVGEDEMMRRLAAHGVLGINGTNSLHQIAAQTGKPLPALLAALVKP